MKNTDVSLTNNFLAILNFMFSNNVKQTDIPQEQLVLMNQATRNGISEHLDSLKDHAAYNDLNKMLEGLQSAPVNLFLHHMLHFFTSDLFYHYKYDSMLSVIKQQAQVIRELKSIS